MNMFFNQWSDEYKMETLENKIGTKFEINRHGQRENFILKDVRRDKVILEQVGRSDTKSVPLKRFMKFYKESK